MWSRVAAGGSSNRGPCLELLRRLDGATRSRAPLAAFSSPASVVRVLLPSPVRTVAATIILTVWWPMFRHDPEVVAPLARHLCHCWCRTDALCYTRTLQLLKHLLVHPERKTAVSMAMLLQGPSGSLKSSLMGFGTDLRDLICWPRPGLMLRSASPGHEALEHHHWVFNGGPVFVTPMWFRGLVFELLGNGIVGKPAYLYLQGATRLDQQFNAFWRDRSILRALAGFGSSLQRQGLVRSSSVSRPKCLLALSSLALPAPAAGQNPGNHRRDPRRRQQRGVDPKGGATISLALPVWAKA